MTDIHQKQNSQRLRTFDFLRGLAILGVIVVHTSQSFPSLINAIDFLAGLGRFGVQLFYFISALTMCYMWKQREGENNPIKNFYIRRFFRIAPLFWIAIPVYLLLNGYDKSYWARLAVERAC
jgi:peptidoglycan/LPS O-acetylase OafA/YrhL